MKKTNKFKENLIQWILTLLFIAIIFLIYYLEETYEVTKYLWAFNIGCLLLMPLYYFIYNYKEKINTRKLENKIIIKNIDFEYYKDIIEEYSPAMLSLILDGLEFDKDLGASVIYLINKGYLKLQDENKIVRTNKDYSKLPEDLKIICDSDINHLLACTRLHTKTGKEEYQAKKSSETRGKWLEAIEKQVVEKGIAIEKEDQSWKTMWILFIIGIAESFFALAKEDYGLFFFAGIVTFILMFLRYWAFDENKFVKTQKGHELYRKVVGLKNYIKDYSNLSESELKEITIWEDYLIYAIILNDTSKLNKEAKDFYKKVCNIREDEIQKPKVKKSIKICAILSVITSLLSIVAFWNSILPIEVIIILILLNFFLIHKGKGYKEPLTIIGYILNIILTALVLLIIIGTLFDL